jgi:hypothetical protein
MRMARRFIDDESGMTLALAIIMIVIIGAMGAGLLTLVNRDLFTVTEENRGQRAFEMADAGVGVAKRQLSSDCASNTSCRGHYNGSATTPDLPDNQWSATNGGLTLNDLDGVGSTPDSVNVQISFTGTSTDPYSFTIVSTGNYGSAKRKIEAKFKGVGVSGGGDGIGHPVYYTKSTIKLDARTASNTWNPVKVNGVSLFSEKDILIEGLQSSGDLRRDYEECKDNSDPVCKNNANPPFTLNSISIGIADELGNWDSQDTKVYKPPTNGTWNTVGRTKLKNDSQEKFDGVGFAAQGKICGFPVGSSAGTCATSTTPNSIADGVYGYDSTTGPRIAPLDPATGYPTRCPITTDPVNPKPITERGNNLTFCPKDPPDFTPQDTSTITFPFPRPAPKPKSLHDLANATKTIYDQCPASGTCTPPWDTLYPNAQSGDRVVFVDANNSTVDWTLDNNANIKGILVVWCGHLVQQTKFQGIILNLHGDGSTFGSTNCAGDATKGTYKNEGQDFSGWLYADGGTSSIAGIEVEPGSGINFLPSGDWSFLNDAFDNSPPTTFGLQGWRELYQ